MVTLGLKPFLQIIAVHGIYELMCSCAAAAKPSSARQKFYINKKKSAGRKGTQYTDK